MTNINISANSFFLFYIFYLGEENPEASETVLECSESVDELFVATFDSLRDTAADAIRRTCEFIGKSVKLIATLFFFLCNQCKFKYFR